MLFDTYLNCDFWYTQHNSNESTKVQNARRKFSTILTQQLYCGGLITLRLCNVSHKSTLVLNGIVVNFVKITFWGVLVVIFISIVLMCVSCYSLEQ